MFAVSGNLLETQLSQTQTADRTKNWKTKMFFGNHHFDIDTKNNLYYDLFCIHTIAKALFSSFCDVFTFNMVYFLSSAESFDK